MTLAKGEDPHGGENEVDPIDQVFGEQLPPSPIGESELVKQSKMNFSGEIAQQFEEHVIPRQIPGYKNMRYRLLGVAHSFLKEGTRFADLGTSNGRMIRDVIAALVATDDRRLVNCDFLGLDYEEDMLKQADRLISELRDDPALQKAVDRFRLEAVLSTDPSPLPRVTLTQHDLRGGLPYGISNCSVISSVLTLQFVPIEHRPRILSQVYNALNPGGAFIFVEKVLAPNIVIDDLFSKMYYQEKSRNGIGHEDIVNKRRSLEGYLMPYTDEGNRELLQGAGFQKRNIDVFWRDLQFMAYIAIKD